MQETGPLATRTYAPLVAASQATSGAIHGMIHCSEELRPRNDVCQNLHVLRTNLIPYRPDRIIQEQSGTGWKKFQVFNMGHRFEFISPKNTQQRSRHRRIFR
jgi:hypothetical protein